MTESIKKYTETKEYIVTLKSSDDLDSFYAEMAEYGKFEGSSAPERAVSCVDQKPFSLKKILELKVYLYILDT
jgi:hypothetical protein